MHWQQWPHLMGRLVHRRDRIHRMTPRFTNQLQILDGKDCAANVSSTASVASRLVIVPPKSP